MTQLATDLGSFNMPMDEALQRLQGTLIGSHENALAFGDHQRKHAWAELTRMRDKLTGAELKQASQARINLLIAGTTDAQGDAIARRAGGQTYAGVDIKNKILLPKSA